MAKRHGNTRINQKVKESLYNCILHHPQVVQYTIKNDCIYAYIDINSKKQLIPKHLLQVSVLELHNIMVSPSEEGILK